MSKYCLIDGLVTDTQDVDAMALNVRVAYEVLRIIEGKPLFFEEHYKRLMHTTKTIGEELNVSSDQLIGWIMKLASENKLNEGNVMIRIEYSDKNQRTLLKFLSHKYPSSENYSTGVEVGVLQAERNNPEAKIENNTLRNLANELIEKNGWYEVLLVNKENKIREGSRSNFVAIKNGQLYTAPLNSVLLGITLLKMIEIAQEYNIEVVYGDLDFDELAGFDALFLTGTSPKILPVRQVDEMVFSVNHPMLQKVMHRYEELIVIDIEKA